MDEEAKIKLNIQKTRTRMGVSQTEMARRLDLSLKGFRDLETGKTSIFTRSFRTFAEQTGTPISELVTGISPADSDDLAMERKSFEQRFEMMEKGYRQEIDDLRSENLQLRKEIQNLKSAIVDKEDIISTDKKLLTQYEKQIQDLLSRT